jgi:hypothetical protein
MTVLKYFLFLFIPLCTVHTQTHTLRYSFEQGQKLQYKRTEKAKILSQTSDGMSATIDRTTANYYSVSIEKGSGSEIAFRIVQDTAITTEQSGVDEPGDKLDLQNLISKKPIEITMSPLGDLKTVRPLVALRISELLGQAVNDTVWAKQVMIFPALPKKALAPGMTWTDARNDTLYPKRTLPKFGAGSGKLIQSLTTIYNVDGLEDIGGFSCLKLSWRGRRFFESKMIYSAMEEFVEEETNTSGSLFFALKQQMVVKTTEKIEKESTRAIFGKEHTVIPASTTTETTLELLTQ